MSSRPRQGSTSREDRPRRRSQGRRQSTGGRQSGGYDLEDLRSPEATHRQRRDSNHKRNEDSQHQPRARRPSAGNRTRSTPDANKNRPRPDVRPLPSYPAPSPANVYTDRDPMLEANAHAANRNIDMSRKKSLIRPERRRLDSDDPGYYYRKHAQKMNVMPSTTGVDPHMEDDEHLTTTSSSSHERFKEGSATSDSNEKRFEDQKDRSASKRHPNKLSRKTATNDVRDREAEKRRQILEGADAHPSLWTAYCHLVTIWCPNALLACFGKRQKAQQRAWREKIGLISIILAIMTLVGYLTFGFTATVCPSNGPLRLQVDKVTPGYLIFHGQAYDLTRSRHPLARGVPAGSNVLWDTGTRLGGMDASFLFQNVNGACKGLITPAANSDVPTDADGNLAWYFPCQLFNRDGSTPPNLTIPYYLGYSCHTMRNARQDFYSLRSSGDVYYTWDDVKNTTRNLMVYSGDVLDLNLLEWFNRTQVTYPSLFDSIRTNPAVRGIDTTLAFSSGQNKQVAECFREIIKVGSIDTESVGCIASKVVLYVSLIFILSIVVTKFVFALLFRWFFSRKFAADKTSMSGNKKKRQQQIEDWTEDIYRPPPKMADPAVNANKRGSFLPTTSRFTSPYAIDSSTAKSRRPPVTMVTQSTGNRSGMGSSTALISYANTNRSETTLPLTMDGSVGKPSTTVESRASLVETHNFSNYSNARYSTALTETDASGPQGFIHESVVPQPPPEWQPFGFPLAHSICLVTAYSEGPEGIRSTLDSIAMTDYCNSHKLLFVVCDGLIKGKGESMSTPDACLSMMKDHAVLPNDVQAFSYVAVASGSKRHNMAKIYAGFYDYGANSIIPLEKQQRVPMILVVKCGTPEEASSSKPGNRGKRDSQIILMSFLQKVMFDERMTELEYEMFNGIWKITGISPDFYEMILMVDADTKVFPDSLTHMISAMVKDPEIMGLCGETKIANKTESWVSMIQVFEYFISHHQAKAFESMFGGVTCLPGCFCMYRIKAPKGGQNYWVPILANPDIVEHYSENVVDTLHKKNLLLLGEDRYLSTLMLKTFPKRKQVFVPQAVCKTTVPATFKVLLSQRRRWINSTVHNLMELVLVRDLCGTFCFSMQFVVGIELIGTLVLPAAISFTIYLIVVAIKAAVENTTAPVIPLILLAMILGLPGLLIVVTAHRVSYVLWMLIYLLSLPIWNFVLPTYAFWHFDDFSWGDTRKTTAGEEKKGGHELEGEFDSSKITMKRWGDFEQERRLRAPPTSHSGYYAGHDRKVSGSGPYAEYHDYP